MAYANTDRYKAAIAAFESAASEDPQIVTDASQAKATEPDNEAASGSPYSLIYHRALWSYVQKLDRELERRPSRHV